MPSDEIVISAHGLGKTYRLFNHPGDRIKQFLSFGTFKFHREFTALKDVSFDIRRGETVGIIGRNGSGKSTLLQLICGILKPSTGTIRTSGRISALLELGAGFNSEFTGRENVYFQGAVMGISRKEMDDRFGEIAAFADIGEYIDQPVRTYSSGMFVRLAFAAMIHTDADILVIDEALAVGDEEFQRKCFSRLAEYLTGRNKVLLFVSHNIRQIERICARTIWMEDSRVVDDGGSAGVCASYHHSLHKQMSVQGETRPKPTYADSGEIEVIRLQLFPGQANVPSDEIEMHTALKIAIEFQCRIDLAAPDIIIGFHTLDSVFIATTNSASLPHPPDFPAGVHRVEVCVRDVILLPGVYQLRLGFLDAHFRAMWAGHKLNTFHVVAPTGLNLVRQPPGLVDMRFEWRFFPAELLHPSSAEHA